MDAVLLAIYHKGNRRLLHEWLAAHYAVIEADAPDAADQPFDLCIVDAVALDRCEARILAYKATQAPLFAPVLLVTQRKDVGLTTRNLWQTVDDLIISPIEKIELQARVHSLILARRLSRQLQERDAALLQRHEERYRALIEHGTDIITLMDAAGTITYESPSVERILGYAPHELVGQNAFSFIHPDDQAVLLASFQSDVQRPGRTATVEMRFRHKDGSWRVLEAAGANRLNDPDVGAIVVSSRDITERKQSELALRRLNAELEQRVAGRTAELSERVAEVEQLNRAMTNLLEDLQAANRQTAAASEQLKAANAELRTFAYSVSHDLKAPLRGMDGYSRLLLEEYADKLDDEGRSFLRTIRHSAQQMSQLIDDLLAYSRLERRSFVVGTVNPRRLLEALLAERSDDAQTRNVTIVNDLTCEAVTAEAEGLLQALRNLLDNALKFTRNVAGPRIEIGSRETARSCILWVRDNGVGFDMQYHDRIFEIFQRLHRTEDYPGTGVGLAIVRKAMERMGGRAWAESEPGKGATFYLEVPK